MDVLVCWSGVDKSSMNNITQEDLKPFYLRIEQYCIEIYKITPDYVRLEKDGKFIAVEDYYNYSDNVYITISLEDLKLSLEEIAKRKTEENLKREAKAKNDRYQEYLKLKKEFENE